MRIIYAMLPTSIFFIPILSSCVKEADNINYPKFTPKIVISGFISPDNKVNRIMLSDNLSLYGYPYQNLSTEIQAVTISDGTIEKTFDSIRIENKFNSSDFPIVEGKTYTIKVKSDVKLLAEASCTVPFKNNLELEIDTSMTIYNNPGYGNIMFINTDIYFTDPEGIVNYYMFYCEVVSYSSKWKPNPIVREDSGPEKPYFTDQGNDGLRSKIKLQLISLSSEVDSSFLKVYLLNTDLNYYNYEKSLANYNSGEDPFTEPSPVFSNVTNGVGIFAACNIDSLIFRLK
jgi:hypothetical protein